MGWMYPRTSLATSPSEIPGRVFLHLCICVHYAFMHRPYAHHHQWNDALPSPQSSPFYSLKSSLQGDEELSVNSSSRHRRHHHPSEVWAVGGTYLSRWFGHDGLECRDLPPIKGIFTRSYFTQKWKGLQCHRRPFRQGPRWNITGAWILLVLKKLLIGSFVCWSAAVRESMMIKEIRQTAGKSLTGNLLTGVNLAQQQQHWSISSQGIPALGCHAWNGPSSSAWTRGGATGLILHRSFSPYPKWSLLRFLCSPQREM